MNDFDFRRLDLNLLITFDALARFCSATKAGEALGLGQPAVSHALARLRELTQDDLFARGSSGLEPTARTEGLTGPIRPALAQIEAPIFGPVKFDAKTSAENFRIGMTDFVAAAVLPLFANLLLDEAPSTTISVINCNESNARELLDAREIDLAVGLFREQEQWLEK